MYIVLSCFHFSLLRGPYKNTAVVKNFKRDNSPRRIVTKPLSWTTSALNCTVEYAWTWARPKPAESNFANERKIWVVGMVRD